MANEKQSVKLLPFLWLAAAIVFVWMLAGLFAYLVLTTQGKFGDTYSAISALFSGLAFAGLTYAVLLQREELKLQREELASTREELRGQKEQAITQNATLVQQTFDNTFFQLLRLHNEIVGAMNIKKHGTTYQSRTCFQLFYESLHLCWNEEINNRNNRDEIQLVTDAYERVYPQIEDNIGHYFRSLDLLPVMPSFIS
jgi:hypothetical protein